MATETFGSDQFSQSRYTPKEGFYVSSSVSLPSGEIDEMGRVIPDKKRRRRTQGERIELEECSKQEKACEKQLEREISKPGIRIPLGWFILILALTLFVFGGSLLIQISGITVAQNKINTMMVDIDARRQSNMVLQTQISAASDQAVICSRALELNMVLADEVKDAIQLEARDTRPLDTKAGTTSTGQGAESITP